MESVSEKAAKETLEVILNSDIAIYTKINPAIICLLREIASKCNETVVLSKDTDIINQPISDEAKAMLSIIYKDCIANEEERNRLNNLYIEKQKEMYSTDNLFKKAKKENFNEKKEETALVEINKLKWYEKILKFLKKLKK